MKNLLSIVIVVATLWITTGCVERLSDSHYKVECSIDKSLRTDSVALFLLEDAYNRVYHASTVGLDSASGAFVFEGQVEQPCVAFLKFSNDSTPFYFVLEHGESHIAIGTNGVVFTGGNLNHEYFDYLKTRGSIMATRKALHSQYLQLAAPDSIVNIEQERQFAQQDSLLADSLDRVTLAMINRGNQASRIVLERFVNTLSPASLKVLNQSQKQ